MKIYITALLLVILSCKDTSVSTANNEKTEPPAELNLAEANRLAALPLNCISQPLPYKAGHVIADSNDLDFPAAHHPAFYGCFDWHSSVHGHWSLIYLLKTFPGLDSAAMAKEQIGHNLTEENIQKEIEYFSMNRYTESYERTYGWAWLLKLAEELYTWEDSLGQKWYQAIEPLATLLSEKYIEYMPKLVYPIRVGEHTNTAFGLSFAYDYALTTGDTALASAIEQTALRFYMNDRDCPLDWEPSGYDFLSPCLQEVDIMRKIMEPDSFRLWLKDFLPGLAQGDLSLTPGKVIDRSDGKLVHLDGLNFSRAWVLYALDSAEYPAAHRIANEHLDYSLEKIKDGDYSGEHWLASFALYAYKSRQ